MGTAPRSPDPADIEHLPPRIAKGKQAERDHQRTDHYREQQREAEADSCHVQQTRGIHQQSQDQEHADLAQPGESVVHPKESGTIGQGAVAQQQPGQIHRHEAAAVQQGRHAEGAEPERQRHHRIEATGRQAEPRQQMASTITGAGANGGADDQLKQDLERNPQTRRRARLKQIGGEHGGEDDGHRVVDARLYFQGDAHPTLELQAAAAEHREDGRGIGGGHHGAEEQRLRPTEPEPMGPRRHQQRGARDAHGCQHACRGGGLPDAH